MIATDFLIVGAGVVGLATAAELARRCSPAAVTVLERHDSFGRETSSRNSEVIHAGIYYPPGSLKARLCVAGNRLLYDFCRAEGIPYQRIGKLIVAADEQEMATLHSLLTTGRENGVPDLRLLEARDIARLEPHISACGALFSPGTGIVDSHRLMARLEQQACGAGAAIAYRHEVLAIEARPDKMMVAYRTPAGAEERLRCRWLINAAGLGAGRIAEWMGIDLDRAGYRLFFCKGEYFSLRRAKARLVSHLIYPPPFKDLRGLGIHVTTSLDGAVRLGPNAFYVDRLDYTVDAGHAGQFYESIRPYLPFVSQDDLMPDTAGIRPKLQAPGEPTRDFEICHEHARGLPGVINLIGIESPGLTSCLSIARMVADIVVHAQR